MAERHVSGVDIADLAAIARGVEERRPAWSQQTEDLSVNLIALAGGSEVPDHANDEVDVLVVAVRGAGSVEISGVRHFLSAGQALIIPKGTSRSIRASEEGFAYLSCHRRRAALLPRPSPPARDTP